MLLCGGLTEWSNKHHDLGTQQVWFVVHAVKKAQMILTETLKSKQKTA
jgi:hypothetical protein